VKQLPKHRIHNYADKLWFGRSFPKVHKAIDLPYIVYGRSHRRFFHTYKEAYPIGYIVSGEAKGALSGAFHIWLDKECSEDKDFRRWLDWAAKEDARYTKQIAKQAKKTRQSRAKKRRKKS
jgi:hypothetical protein